MAIVCRECANAPYPRTDPPRLMVVWYQGEPYCREHAISRGVNPEICPHCHGPNDHGEECRYVIGDLAEKPRHLPPTGRA